MKRLALSFIVALAACTSDKPAATDTTVVSGENSAAQRAADELNKTLTPKGETEPPAPMPAPVDNEPAGPWDVTSSGIGPLKAGMGIEESNVVLHSTLPVPAKLSECDYIKPKNAPAGVALMYENGIFSRVDVTSGSVKTVEGARIGSTEEEIKSLYKGQVTVNPAKYDSGHTLVVTPKSGGNNRIVFETDGKKVTRFRSGREPAVEYVEGCG